MTELAAKNPVCGKVQEKLEEIGTFEDVARLALKLAGAPDGSLELAGGLKRLGAFLLSESADDSAADQFDTAPIAGNYRELIVHAYNATLEVEDMVGEHLKNFHTPGGPECPAPLPQTPES